MFEEKIGPCKTDTFVLESDSIFTKYPIQKLLKDLCVNVDSVTFKNLRGEIFIQVIVDTIGKPCVLSIRNKLNVKTQETNFVRTINEKTFWGIPSYLSPRTNNFEHKGQRGKVAAIIFLFFTKETTVIDRLGYSFEKRDWNELESYTQANR